ncbi:MAG: YfbR-like 5'-deoxynucleotidase, partial [Candidatus Micrarchaeota archaeon]
IVAFVLARMEGMDDAQARKICVAGAFHDMHETRLGDMNKITHGYVTITKELERKVEEEQAATLPDELKGSVLGTMELSEEERAILKDADYLECAFQAKEYVDIGHRGAESWIESIDGRLKTDSAKKLLAKMRKTDSNSWWNGLKKLE